jgi:ligand-binding sensor domain-containing protein
MATTFGDYEILAKLGQGGMGAVYKARQPGVDRVVALKVMNPGSATPEAYVRFQREMQIVGRLRHPNIVRLFTVGQEKNRVFFTMDFVDGESLAQLIAEAKSEEDRKSLVKLLATVARAIHYAHTEKVIHRDLKPSNIIVDKQGNPLVTDFGLAKELGAGQTVTITGEAVGTVQYMSPEQAQGQQDIGPASDVYSLGVILYEILTGKPPFEGPTPTAVLKKLLQEKPEPPRKVNRAVSKGLDAIVMKCLEKAPKGRYATAEALAKDIERWLTGKTPVAAKRPTAAALARAHPAVAAGIAASLAAVVLAGTFVYLHFQREKASTKAREEETIREANELEQKAAAEAQARQAEETRRESEEKNRAAAEAEAQRKAEEETRARVEAEARRKAEEEARARAEREKREAEKAREESIPLARAHAVITSYHSLNDVSALGEIRSGIWVGTNGGVFELDPASGERVAFFPCATVRAIVADGQGTLWAATEDGVCCFDGTRWQTYTTKDGLVSNFVTAIAIDTQGRKWFGTKSGVSCLDGTTWRTYTTKDGLPYNDVHAIAIDAQGRKWFGTFGGISCFDGTTWRTYTTKDGLAENPVTAIAIDAQGWKWIGSFLGGGSGVSCFDGTTWRTYTTRNGLAQGHLVAIAIDAQGRKWFGALGNGVSCFDGTTWRTYTTKDGLAGSAVTAITIDAQGRKWFGTKSGVSCFDGTTWRTYTQKDGLADNDVRAVAIDAQGQKWFGTKSGGVSCFDGTTWRTYTTKDGLAHGIVLAVAIDAQRQEWFGTSDSGVSCFDGTTWRTYTTQDGLASNYVDAIAIDAQGRKWFGTSRGVSCFDGTTWRTPADYGVLAIAIDAQGRKWFATAGGVTCFDGTTWCTYTTEDWRAPGQAHRITIFDGTTWRTYTTKDGLASNRLSAIAIDAQGRKWFGHGQYQAGEKLIGSGGVSCFDGTTWRTYTTKDGLANNGVWAITIDAEARKWFGTGGGVSCFDGTTWRTWTEKDFLAGARVQALAVDRDGSVWGGTDTGVSHIVLTEDKP